MRSVLTATKSESAQVYSIGLYLFSSPCLLFFGSAERAGARFLTNKPLRGAAASVAPEKSIY